MDILKISACMKLINEIQHKKSKPAMFPVCILLLEMENVQIKVTEIKSALLLLEMSTAAGNES